MCIRDSKGTVHGPKPVKSISSIRTPCLPPRIPLLNLNLNCVDVDGGILKTPDAINVADVGVAEVNVVVDHVNPLSSEYSTNTGAFGGAPVPYVPTKKLKERPET